MTIAIYDLDKTPFPNYALMRISKYHKDRSNTVEWYKPEWHNAYSKIFASSVFDYSDRSCVTNDMVTGGAGFDIMSVLPEEIEECEPDYSIYPNCDYSIIWFDMGCFRKCPFCIVHKMGEHREVNRLTINPDGNYVKVQDDNFFLGDWKSKIHWLSGCGQPLDMQNIDARTLTGKQAKALNKLKLKHQIKMAWDNPRERINWKQITQWIKPYKIMVYVLIGYWSTEEEDLHRVMRLKELRLDPFVMLYNKNDRYQKRFARWVNHKAIFKTVKWEDYQKGGINNGRGIQK